MAGGKPPQAPHSGGRASSSPPWRGASLLEPPMAGGKPPQAPHSGGRASSSPPWRGASLLEPPSGPRPCWAHRSAPAPCGQRPSAPLSTTLDRTYRFRPGPAGPPAPCPTGGRCRSLPATQELRREAAPRCSAPPPLATHISTRRSQRPWTAVTDPRPSGGLAMRMPAAARPRPSFCAHQAAPAPLLGGRRHLPAAPEALPAAARRRPALDHLGGHTLRHLRLVSCSLLPPTRRGASLLEPPPWRGASLLEPPSGPRPRWAHRSAPAPCG
jgi:hypothetical protein